jgi:predicted nuclease of predicted toxin-antitoxin system
MKLLLDANMPRSTQAALAQRGFDAVAVRDILPPAR